MRRVFLCTLMVLGFLNFGFGQSNATTGKISVHIYDNHELLEQFEVAGNEALSFDIPTYIKENSHLGRLLINGSLTTNTTTTIIRFDSKNEKIKDADYICTEVQSSMKPFIGVKVSGRDDLNGVDIKEVIQATPAATAGIVASESITQFNGEIINSNCDLKKAVKDSEIGELVELHMNTGSNQYSTHVLIGGREVKTVTYKYCKKEAVEMVQESNLEVNTPTASLSSFPNPTSSMSHINFTSESYEDVTFSVIGITGNLIHKETFSNFNGYLRLDYNHKNQGAGTYIIMIQQGEEIHKHLVQLIKS